MSVSRITSFCFLLWSLFLASCGTTGLFSNKTGLKEPDAFLAEARQVSNLVRTFGEVSIEEHTSYLNQLTKRMYPELPCQNGQASCVSLKILATETPIAEISSTSTVLLSQGFMRRLSREDMFAFVLAHELGHRILKHGDIRDKKIDYSTIEIEADRIAAYAACRAGFSLDGSFLALSAADEFAHNQPLFYASAKKRLLALQSIVRSCSLNPFQQIDSPSFHAFLKTALKVPSVQ